MSSNCRQCIIVGNGPSASDWRGVAETLPRSWSPDRLEVFAVNWAAPDWPVGWRVAMDGRTYARPPEDERPALFANAVQCLPAGGYVAHWCALDWLRDNCPATAAALQRYRVLLWPAHHEQIPSSGLGALWAARHLGYTDALLVGYDLAGDADCAGLTYGARTDKRWEREREQMRALSADLGLYLYQWRGEVTPWR